VKALYDFDGESSSAELSIRVGEILTITRKDVGSGWMEGENSNGQIGLFPEAYVEVSTCHKNTQRLYRIVL
jgi:sorting nexin-9/18/33